MTRTHPLRLATPLLALLGATLLGAAAYEGLIALGIIGIGPLPGQGPIAGGGALFLALLALMAGSLLALALAGRDDFPPAFVLLPPAAFAFVFCRFFSFDPYYAPTLRRMSEDGLVSGWLLLFLGLATVALVILLGLRPRLALFLTTPFLLFTALTALAMSAGH